MLLEVRNVYKNFGGVHAEQDVSLSVDANQIVSLIGPNGAGKTTIFNLISGIYKLDSGSITFDGKDLVSLEPHAISRLGIARTFQNIRLFKGLSVIDNLMAARDPVTSYNLFSAMLKLPSCRNADRANREQCMEFLELVGLAKYRDEDPLNLPYGLQRRVELARALARNPRLIMLDEPAAGLNPSEVTAFITLIQDLKSRFGFGILIIEHRMMVVNGLSEYIYVLNFGKLLAQGSPEFIRNDPEVITAYLGEEVQDARNPEPQR
jgi:branched-chain amino acid transport system ATP-binding protein